MHFRDESDTYLHFHALYSGIKLTLRIESDIRCVMFMQFHVYLGGVKVIVKMKVEDKFSQLVRYSCFSFLCV